MTPIDLTDAAVSYAEMGLAVFPLQPGKKVPFEGTRGLYDATREPRAVTGLFRGKTGANIAVRCGAESGIWVLDVDADAQKGVDGRLTLSILQDEHGELPETWTVCTPRGGRHYWFRHPGRLIKPAVGVRHGIDVRGDGSYVVAPPSMNCASGWTWAEDHDPADLPLADAPAWLLEIISPAPAESPAPNLDAPPRHDQLRSYSVKLAAAGVPADHALAMLRGVRDAMPGDRRIGDGELRGLVESASRKYAKGDSAATALLLPELYEIPDSIDQYGDTDATLRGVLGEARSLADWRESTPPEWLTEGILQRSSLTFFTSVAGAGKSLTLQDLLFRLASGCGGFWFDAYALISVPLRVLLIEAENGINRLGRRALEAVIGNGLSAEMVDLAAANITVYPAEELARRPLVMQALPLLAQPGAWDVIVLDPLRSFLPEAVEEEADNVAVGRMADFLVKLALRSGAAVLVVDHDTKAGVALRGASAKGDAAVFVVHLEPDRDEPGLIKLTASKQRDPGGLREIMIRRTSKPKTPEGFMPYRLERDTAAEEAAAAKAAAKGRNKMATINERDLLVKTAVEEMYAETKRGCSVRALADHMGVSKSSVAARVQHLVGLGALHRPEDNGPVYPLNAKPEASCEKR